jgi:hypothetical protein
VQSRPAIAEIGSCHRPRTVATLPASRWNRAGQVTQARAQGIGPMHRFVSAPCDGSERAPTPAAEVAPFNLPAVA